MTIAHELVHRSRWERASAAAAAVAVRTARPAVQRALESDEQSDPGTAFGALPHVAAFSSCQSLIVSCACPPGPCVCGCVLE